jgi:hypothetical protein
MNPSASFELVPGPAQTLKLSRILGSVISTTLATFPPLTVILIDLAFAASLAGMAYLEIPEIASTMGANTGEATNCWKWDYK